jgi:very-short-patch-repair endonuclease
VHSDLASLSELLTKAEELKAAATQAYQGSELPVSASRLVEQLLPPGSESTALARTAVEVLDLYSEFKQSARRYLGLAGGKLASSSLQSLADSMENVRQNANRLNDWVKWAEVRQEAERRGLLPMVEALGNGLIEDPKEDFKAAYFAWWLPLAIDSKPKLRSFVHWEQENRIERFRELISLVQHLAASQVRRAVAHGLPAKDEVARKSELGLLRHQLGLQRPSESIRGLIQGMPNTFTKLAPCVLMSPLSVAQYLPTEQATFDMVIFDEASQITTWDAVGAIARGRQSIIVGDPKQLPPTNFFGRTDDGDGYAVEVHDRDLPSILDEASAAGLPLHQLNWHYRSRDEDLIAFSNYHYYSQRLVTFPSPETDSRAVQFHRVKGVYARGSGRTNEIEARAVVAFVVRRLEEWVSRPFDRRLSIGVITFNAPQQELILDLLDAERTKRPGLEWFFSDEREEPVIVKNLENVQGDERDVMVFSITFGHDHAGKLSMDFGAVNREGGEKRLNVAVTRAKSEFHVFSSISADEIDLKRAKGLGVSHLKSYLDYAERGPTALAAMDEGSLGPAESPFEESVATALRTKGWEVRTQIGVSGFRIDLGVVHPDLAGKYLAGIECDGATYHRSATARDRDQIREAVLRNLGWEILRIWSTDWFMRQSDAIDRIDTALNDLLEASREAAKQREQDLALDPDPEQATGLESETLECEDDLDDDLKDELDVGRLVFSSNAPEHIAESQSELTLQNDCDATLFFDPSYTPRLSALIDKVVTEQGPISEAMLCRTIARLHGWQRTGRRIQQRVMDCIGINECHHEHGSVFVWAPGTFQQRLAFRAGLSRSPRDIPQAEIHGLIAANPRVLEEPDPPKALAKLLGLERLSSDTRGYVESCLSLYQGP